MELTAGYPYWLINNGLLHHYPRLTGPTKAAVTIIGGGISGALAAYYLVNAGISCALVDGRTIGLGSTCASTSLLQYELDMPLQEMVQKKGRNVAFRAYQLCGEAIDKLIAIMQATGYQEYESNKSLFFSTHKRERRFMEEEYRLRKEAGFEIDILNAVDIFTHYGLKAQSALLSSKGASINAYTLTHHLLQYCMPKGLQVYDRTTVASIREEDQQMVLTTQDGHELRSSYVVNATGYGVVDFIEKDIVNFDCTYAIVSEHQSELDPLWRDRALLWNTDNPYLYMRLTTDNRIIAGGRDEPFSNKVTRQLFLDKKAALIEKDVKKLLPGTAFKREFAWSGTFGKTKDALPYIGAYPKTPRVFYALGFGGNGITFSQIAAEIITDLLQGKQHPDASMFSFDR